MILLNVPFSEKDEAKALGALWNPDLKKWYVRDTVDCVKFLKWLLPEYNDYYQFYILTGSLYIAEATKMCFKCGGETRVIGLAVDSYYTVTVDEDSEGEDSYVCEYNDMPMITPINETLPKPLLDYCCSNWNFKNTYSRTTKSSCLSNNCDHCGTLQGNYFLFSEVNSPFSFLDEEKASRLTLHEVKLKYDILVPSLEEAYDSSWDMISAHSVKKPLFEL